MYGIVFVVVDVIVPVVVVVVDKVVVVRVVVVDTVIDVVVVVVVDGTSFASISSSTWIVRDIID